MFNEEISLKRRKYFIRALPLLLILLFIILFWKDVWETFRFFLRLLLRYIGLAIPLFTPDTPFSLVLIGFNFFFGFLLFFLIWLFLTSKQALLPVSSVGEIIHTAMLLVLYILKLHGPAVQVKDGKLRADAEELHRFDPGVAVVDSNSAIVLEQVSWASRILPSVMDFLLKAFSWILASTGLLRGAKDPVRVCGPGLTFIQFGERVQGVGDLAQESGPVGDVSGVVDLRIQYKLSPKQSNYDPELIRASVSAYTRDGIELTTNVWALFSIGLDPDKAPHVLHIACAGEHLPKNLRIVSLEEENGAIQIKIKDDELDPEDRNEIFAFLSSNPVLYPYTPIEVGGREPVFDANRVFSAVYGRSRSRIDKEQILPWMDLPVKVAVDCFREILSHFNFDELYRPDADGNLMIDNMRKELRTRMRNSGLLNYRLVDHLRPGRQLITIDKEIYHDPRDLLVSPVRALQTTKILRDRGIKMIAAGFPNLVPTDEVYMQWLASWRAKWERDTKATRAIADLEAKRIYNRARVHAQRELAISFQEIFEDGRHSKEALALRILQALETIAADRETQRLLPADTISMLRSIHDWLLPGEMGMGIGNPAPGPQEGEDE